MALAPGTRIGPYEVASAIGAGGMGEVYRGRDTRLGRDVAIKVLPGLFASDPERTARFAREAQILASPNHPHGILGLCAEGRWEAAQAALRKIDLAAVLDGAANLPASSDSAGDAGR